MPSREQSYNFWLMEDFYRQMAEEEGGEAPESRFKKTDLLDFVVAGTTFCKEFDKSDEDFVKDGMTLIVKREDNKHDANAIALYVGDVRIGYVPKNQNPVLAKLLDAGKILIARVISAHYNEGWEKINARISMIEM